MFNRTTEVWSQGEHEFGFNIGELRALQDKCDASPYVVLMRLTMGAWLVDDIIEVIRLGLIGGGMPGDAALKLALRAFEQAPACELQLLAHKILAPSLLGEEGDPVGEPEGVKSQPNSGSLANSTEPAQ